MNNIRKEFKNPPSKYRTAPFWSWNDEMTADEIEFQLKDFKAHGIGGGFAHPRIGMITEYLSEDFFAAFKNALDTAKAEDLKIYMYDENAWPSGFAGGLTVRKNEDAVSPLAKSRVVEAANPVFGGPVIFAAEVDGKSFGKVLTDVPREEWKNHTDGNVFVIYEIYPFDALWTGDRPYIDVSKREAIDTFMEITHEEYKKHFAEDFGTYIPAIFSDEAHMMGDWPEVVPYAPHIEEKFKELCGYSLKPNLAAVFKNFEGIAFDRPCEKVRYDYFYTLHELWIDNFVRPIAKWCEENNVAWTGHDIEHHWPQAHGGRINPSEQTTYEFRQWPALDLLLCDHLIEQPSNFDKYLMYEIRSAANQFGWERTLCEAYGAGGYHSTMYDYKRLGDYLMAGGINFICQHLSLYSYLGSRKRDCPQSFDYRQPWWDEYTKMADYFARTSQITSAGKMNQRLLLLNASTTGYLVPIEEECGMVDHALDPAQVKNPDMSDYLTIVLRLTDEGWDWDVGDEYSIARNTVCENGLFKFGKQAYDTVILSKNMRNLRADTVRLLLEFAACGGKLVTTDADLSSVGEYIDGETGREETRALRAVLTTVSSPDGLCDYVADTHERFISSSVPFPTGVQHIRRDLGDGVSAYFIVNHSMGTFESELTFKGDSIAKWDLYTGDAHGLKCTHKDGTVTVPVKMERCAALLLVTGEGLDEEEALPEATRKAELCRKSIEKDTSNMFALDTAVLETKGEVYPERYVLEVADKLYRVNGLDGTPWTHIQVGTETMDLNDTFGEDSAFTVKYSFNVDAGVLPLRITAGVERPELWSVLVNGVEAYADGCDPLDHGMGSYDISSLVREGENELVLRAEKFNVLCEVEAVILRGEFGVEARGEKFVLTAPERIADYGSWGEYKLPFYSGGVNYTYETTLESAPASAKITLGRFDATIVSVKVNGEYAGFIGEEGGVSLEIGKYLKEGTNTITLRVVGSLRNILGPHHGYNKYIPYDWSMYKRDHLPTADEYAFSDYGLYESPTLTIA